VHRPEEEAGTPPTQTTTSSRYRAWKERARGLILARRDEQAFVAAGASSEEQLASLGLSYDAMVRAVRELEDRAGRLLTAIAFFLTAGTATLAVQKVRDFRYEFENGASVKLPFLDLAENKVERWLEWQQGSPTELRDRRAATLSLETRRLALLAEYKYGRLVEARGLLLIAVSCLLVAFILLGQALGYGTDMNTVPWGWKMAIVPGLALALITWVAGNDRYRLETEIDSLHDPSSPRQAFSMMATMMASHPVLVLSASALTGWWLAGLASVVIGTSVVATIYVARWKTLHGPQQPECWLNQLGGVRLMVFPLVELVPLVHPALHNYLIASSFVPILFFEGIRLFDALVSRLRFGPS
jgi:hypothetical protein